MQRTVRRRARSPTCPPAPPLSLWPPLYTSPLPPSHRRRTSPQSTRAAAPPPPPPARSGKPSRVPLPRPPPSSSHRLPEPLRRDRAPQRLDIEHLSSRPHSDASLLVSDAPPPRREEPPSPRPIFGTLRPSPPSPLPPPPPPLPSPPRHPAPPSSPLPTRPPRLPHPPPPPPPPPALATSPAPAPPPPEIDHPPLRRRPAPPPPALPCVGVHPTPRTPPPHSPAISPPPTPALPAPSERLRAEHLVPVLPCCVSPSPACRRPPVIRLRLRCMSSRTLSSGRTHFSRRLYPPPLGPAHCLPSSSLHHLRESTSCSASLALTTALAPPPPRLYPLLSTSARTPAPPSLLIPRDAPTPLNPPRSRDLPTRPPSPDTNADPLPCPRGAAAGCRSRRLRPDGERPRAELAALPERRLVVVVRIEGVARGAREIDPARLVEVAEVDDHAHRRHPVDAVAESRPIRWRSRSTSRRRARRARG